MLPVQISFFEELFVPSSHLQLDSKILWMLRDAIRKKHPALECPHSITRMHIFMQLEKLK